MEFYAPSCPSAFSDHSISILHDAVLDSYFKLLYFHGVSFFSPPLYSYLDCIALLLSLSPQIISRQRCHRYKKHSKTRARHQTQHACAEIQYLAQHSGAVSFSGIHAWSRQDLREHFLWGNQNNFKKQIQVEVIQCTCPPTQKFSLYFFSFLF